MRSAASIAVMVGVGIGMLLSTLIFEIVDTGGDVTTRIVIFLGSAIMCSLASLIGLMVGVAYEKRKSIEFLLELMNALNEQKGKPTDANSDIKGSDPA